MLKYYNLDHKYDTVKEWYDGYRFGNVDVYCPWDVISYVDDLTDDPDIPQRITGLIPAAMMLSVISLKRLETG